MTLILKRAALRLALLAFALVASAAAQASQGSGCMPVTGTVSGLTFATDVNTGLAALISSNSGGSAPVTDCSSVSIEGQLWLDTSTGQPAWRVYDGTSWSSFGRFDLANHLWMPVVGGGIGSVTAASSADLCSTPQAVLTITGTTTINGFGSTCIVGQIKVLNFSGAVTLTNSATLILPSGANITTAAGDSAIAVVIASGTWEIVSYQRASGQPVVGQSGVYLGAAAGLKIANGATPSLQMTITAASALIPNAAGSAVQRRTSVSVTCSTATSGASGLDTGSVAANSLYNIWLIDNGTAPVCMFSLSAASPTMPSGYSYLFRAGAVFTDGSANFYRMQQVGKYAEFVVTPSTNTAYFPTIESGSVIGTVTASNGLAAFNISGAGGQAPPTATIVKVLLNNTGYYSAVAATNNFGGTGTLTQPPCSASNVSIAFQCEIELQGTSIYYGTAYASNGLFLIGWYDAVNAN